MNDSQLGTYDPLFLQRELRKVRHDSRIAARNGNFRLVVKLTGEAARLNRLLHPPEQAKPAVPLPS